VETSEEQAQPFADVAAETASPEQETQWRALSEDLDRALQKMSDDHRRAFELSVLKQYTYSEIANTTGWSLPRVKSNIYRARKKLIAQLGDYLPGN
jgi:RNA polymerase sigma-70 factor (ECF subfamily)